MDVKFPEYIFHGGCYGCTHQEVEGVDFCIGCRYFDAKWSLPNLNNSPPTKAELKRRELKEKYHLLER